MRFRQVRLQLQSSLGQSARFFSTRSRGIERVHDPTFQLRVARDREGEVWVQFDSALIKLLALFQFFEVLKSARKIMRLDKGQIGLPVFSGLALYLRFFPGRELGLERIADFLGEIGLNREDIS